MTIYILDNDPAKCAQALDDKSLDKMIKDIAQVLCDVYRVTIWHHDYTKNTLNIPLDWSGKSKWIQWARECIVNYKYLVELGRLCVWEKYHRKGISQEHIYNDKYYDAICWSRDNCPDLPDKDAHALFFGTTKCIDTYGKPTPFPLVMPKKYSEHTPANRRLNKLKIMDKFQIYHAYRNYYQAKLKKYIHLQAKKYNESSSRWAKANNLWTRREKPKWIML